MKVSERLHIPIEPSLNRSHTWISNPPENESRIERTTVWSFPKRGDWAVHKGDYKGNWPPQLVLNLLARFSKKGGLVLDPFVGGGTTLIECWRLGYRSIGTDVSPHALSFSRKRLSDMQRLWPKDRPLSRDLKPVLIKADARNLGFLSDNQIDFICGQPPYWNSQKYSASQRGDLSGITEIDVFIDAVRLVAKELFRVLKPSKNCAILIGDVRRKGKFTILSHQVWQIFEQAGFETEENLVKIQHRDKSTAFYAGSRRSPRYRIKHEHLYVFRKPADQK